MGARVDRSLPGWRVFGAQEQFKPVAHQKVEGSRIYEDTDDPHCTLYHERCPMWEPTKFLL